jgi:hypothetical protein
VQRAEHIEEWRKLKAEQAADSSHPNKQPAYLGLSKTSESLGEAKAAAAPDHRSPRS